MGGLGNQMFQYAAGRGLSIKNNVELKFDLTHLLDRSPSLSIVFRDYDLDVFPGIGAFAATNDEISALFKIAPARALHQKISRKILPTKNYLKEKSFRFDERFKKAGANVYLDGYWQSEKYFSAIVQIIRKDFEFSPLSGHANFALLDNIKSANSVCLNVRRGDFVSHAGSSGFHGFKGLDYINNAVLHIGNKISDPHFFIFSDDIEWCRENIVLQHPVTIVDHLHAGKKFVDYLQLMTACNHFIIPNSSFAWWAAWFNQNPDKIVVAPQLWFTDPLIDTSDLIPLSWFRL